MGGRVDSGLTRAPRTPRIPVPLLSALAALYVAAVWLGRTVQVDPVPLSLAWPAAGVVTVALLALPVRRDRLLAVVVVAATTGVINHLTGIEPATAYLLGTMSAVNGLVAASVLRTRGWALGRGVRTFADVRSLGLAAVCAGGLSAVVGGALAGLRLDTDLLPAMGIIGMRNAVSTFVVAAALLGLPSLGRGRRRRGCLRLVIACVVVAGVVSVIPLPVAFVMVAPLIVLALRCGPEPTSVAVALQGVVAVAATTRGYGQFALIARPEVQVLVAQMLIVLLAGGALVVAITARDREEALAASRRDRDRLRDHMEAALVAAAHLVVDADGRVRTVEANAALVELTGRRRGQLLGSDPLAWLCSADAAALSRGLDALTRRTAAGWRGSLRMAESHGGGWVDAALGLVESETTDGAGARALVKLQMIDITAQRQAEEELARVALHDDLTGLANRVLWADRLRRALARGRGAAGDVAVLYVDIDHFKQVNDAYGHDVGDEVLREVGVRLRSVVGPLDTVGRMGGDEFVLLQVAASIRPPGRAGEEAGDLAERVLAAMRPPVVVGSRVLAVTVSVGIALAEPGEQQGRVVLRRADTALYAAKSAGRARVEFYRAEEHRDDEYAGDLLLDLEQGHRAGELVVHYQPIVDATSGRPVALEALLRWYHPLRGCLEPAEFLDVLETSDLIHPVGASVLERACADGARLQASGHPLDVHVNISAAELARPGVVERVAATLDRTGLAPGALVLEVTETRLVAVTRALVDELRALRDLGVRLAVDDFGTGFSTLTHLVELPVGVVKLDRRFVRDITVSASARSVSTGVRAMAEGLGVDAIAEGVESEEQAAALRELGYRLLQGYHCGMPGPIEQVWEALVPTG